MYSMDTPVTALNGIGEKKASLLSVIGIKTLGDLIRYLPRAYQNKGDIKTLMEAANENTPCSMIVTVAAEPKNALLKNRKTLTKFPVVDSTGRCSVVFFNQAYIKDNVHIGETYRIFAKVTRKKSGAEIIAPEMELVTEGIQLPDIFPIYPLTKGLTQKALRGYISTALAALDGNIEPLIPEEIRKKYSLMNVYDAYRAVHFPRSFAFASEARKYFVFEELFIFALGISTSKKSNTGLPAHPLKTTHEHFSIFREALPFEPTSAQKRVINEIAKDLAKPFAMHRLVTGDVGSGKTLCAAAAAFICTQNGYQCTLMAPTEILAKQHYNDLSPLMESLGCKCALLTGSLTAAEKRAVHKKIKEGDADFIIGTHALLSDSVELKRPALSICDEQHRFGIAQRAKLGEKSGNMHILVMSATPIPRTLALTLYGDLDISAVDEMPPGRMKVSTFLVNESYRERLNAFIRKEALSGHGIYIVCPSIEKDENDETADLALFDASGDRIQPLKDAVGYTEELKKSLPDINIGYVHGRMKPAEKDRIMGDFSSGKLSVLVSTTVIEVGVNVPSATLMIVENAERFGLSQLHQLRGRVGRGKEKSFCVLVSDSDSKTSLERLRALCDSTDGYKIAEKDLEIRGPGDFFAGSLSKRQHGSFSFRVASLASDAELFSKAFSAAREYAEGEKNPQTEKALEKFMTNGISGRS